MRLLLLVMNGALLPFLAGCGSEAEGPHLVPAAGELTYQGKPLEGYEVFLQPTSPEEPRAGGVTDAEGKFVLQTVGEDGAQPGDYRVYIVKQMEELAGEPGREVPMSQPAARSVLPKKYEDPDTSGLEVTIPEAGDQAIALEL
ncbi:hypothetical protein [Candidatus Laterigemmans baculatus]|uniref:hypothetical protein n=1 Tax=Candidatus Laterigemmans baculatus TaxID=2770505 RepID=UPI0013DA89D8|nr:hypothetical protein [Candidatus Laterigemmans baculatus]